MRNIKASLSAALAIAAFGTMSNAAYTVGGGTVSSATKASAKSGEKSTGASQRAVADKLARLGVNAYSSRRAGYPTPGWSVAQDRRNSRKRRNVARNRRAQR